MKLTLIALKRATQLPLNYQYAVASLIYTTLGNASVEFASRLHDEGYRAEGRKFKLFTFSRLTTHRSRIVGDQLLLDDPMISFQISSPVGDFIGHFVTGLFQSETFAIAGAHFRLLQPEILAPPIFTERMSLRALSPITESIGDGQKHPRFLAPEDDWSEVVRRNLLRKYQALNGRAPSDTRLLWTWDHVYLTEAAKRGRRASVLTDIRGTKIRGWLAPFTVEGSVELIEVGYEAGFGSRNSMGHGMAELL